METAQQQAYFRPRSFAEALYVLNTQEALIVSGCTDFYPAFVGRPLPNRLIDVSAVAEMRDIRISEHEVRIGGAVTWSEIAAAKLPTALNALQMAARQIGAVQVQNRGTIAGNLCTASPAADGVPPLLVLDAEVELASRRGLRRLPLSDFLRGYRRTALALGEVLSAIVVPMRPGQSTSAFRKLGARKYLVISIVMVAALFRRRDDGTLLDVAVAVGSASEMAVRLATLERELVGLKVEDLTPALLRPDHFSELRPIDDVRATAWYRREAALQLVAETLLEAARG